MHCLSENLQNFLLDVLGLLTFSCNFQKRIHKEIIMMTNSPPPNTKLCTDRLESTGDFVVEVTGAQETLFNGEHFQLLFKFGERYPFESPQVSLFILKLNKFMVTLIVVNKVLKNDDD